MSADKALDGFGRYAGPATLIMASLADGAKHGYALTKDIESFAGVRVAPGTLYEALARLQAQGLIEPVESHDRRRPYRLTEVGATTLQAQRPRHAVQDPAGHQLLQAAPAAADARRATHVHRHVPEVPGRALALARGRLHQRPDGHRRRRPARLLTRPAGSRHG